MFRIYMSWRHVPALAAQSYPSHQTTSLAASRGITQPVPPYQQALHPYHSCKRTVIDVTLAPKVHALIAPGIYTLPKAFPPRKQTAIKTTMNNGSVELKCRLTSSVKLYISRRDRLSLSGRSDGCVSAWRGRWFEGLIAPILTSP